MIAFRQISCILGLLIAILGSVMLFPMGIDVFYGYKGWQSFGLSSLVCMFIGGLMFISNRDNDEKLSKRDVFILIVLTWFLLPFFGSVPIYMSDLNLSFVDAYFETVSGVTTTGATILNTLETTPPSILLWRSLLQWLGGVGIVVMVSGLLPIMQIGGMQLLQLEFDPRMEKTLPRTAQISLFVVIAYAILTLICAMLYFKFGMSGFDAINHAMTTMATGGYSTHDKSMGFFDNPNILIVATVFMIIASLPFVLIISTFYGGVKELYNDVQARWFLRILSFIVVLMIWNNYVYFDDFSENIRQTAFNVTSVMTGTGYSSVDYGSWGTVAIPIMLIVMMLGGGAGSTTCGVKMFRLKILYETVTIGFRRLIHPNGVIIPYYGKSVIEPETSATVVSYIAVFLLTGILFGIVYASLGYDMVTAFSASFSALSCLGPGLGDVIGPNSTYKDVTDGFKWVFIVEMILGRLEIFTVLMLLTPSFWKD